MRWWATTRVVDVELLDRVGEAERVKALVAHCAPLTRSVCPSALGRRSTVCMNINVNKLLLLLLCPYISLAGAAYLWVRACLCVYICACIHGCVGTVYRPKMPR